MDRLTYFWENPNQAGAFLVIIIPLFWMIDCWSKRKKSYIILGLSILFIEFSLITLAVLTASRAAFLALLFSFFAFILLKFKDQRGTKGFLKALRNRITMIRIILIIGLFFLTDISSRFFSIAESDPSTLNRLSLWKDGLQMIFPAISGWGWGQSGYSHLQYFQNVDVALYYGAMVNSYLEIAVSGGILALLFFLIPILYPFISNGFKIKGQFKYQQIKRIFFPSIIAFSIVIFFSTLIARLEIMLLALFMIASIMAIDIINGVKLFLNNIINSLIGSLATVCLLLFVAKNVNNESDWDVSLMENKSVYFEKRSHDEDGYVINFWTDFLTLGTGFGKEVRRSVRELDDLQSYTIAPFYSSYEDGVSSYEIIFGARVRELDFDILSGKHILLVAPIGKPPDGRVPKSKNCAVILPEFDEFGYGFEWKDWALEHNVAIIYANNCSQNVSSQFPNLLNLWIRRS